MSKHLCVLLAALAFLPGCSLVPKKLLDAIPEVHMPRIWPFGSAKKPEVPSATLPTWVGTVVMVDAEHGFVLVDTGAPIQLQPGAKLIAFRDQRSTASLAATTEVRPPYLALEIKGGMPSIGDQVALDEGRPAPEAKPDERPAENLAAKQPKPDREPSKPKVKADKPKAAPAAKPASAPVAKPSAKPSASPARE